MPLSSQWFTTGNSPTAQKRLNDCLSYDWAHIPPGDTGEHVQVVQVALETLTGMTISDDEKSFQGQAKVGYYGPTTAAAALAYKSNHKPPILNFALRQTTPDPIVGKLTLQNLDDDMAILERGPVTPVAPNNGGNTVVVTTETRVVARTTDQRIATQYPTAPGLTPDPNNLPNPVDVLGKFAQFLVDLKVADDIAAERVAAHPLETGDPDWGKESSRREAQVDTRQVMSRMDVTTVVWTESDLLDSLLANTYYVCARRIYTYTYGVGNANQPVACTRTVVIPADASAGTPQQQTTVTFQAKQPASYTDP